MFLLCSMNVSLQLYEIFTFLGEMGGIVQVHAENGEIIAEVTHLSQQPPPSSPPWLNL